MKPVWNITPTPMGLMISLADAIVPHLDRAGASFHVEASPGAMARFAAGAVLKAQGKAFVPETRGELLERADRLGLLLPGDAPLSKEDGAILALRLLDLLEERGD